MNKKIKKKTKTYIKGLDSLRALAIIGVTLFHFFPDTIKGGYLGVSLFFVLTGFLLALHPPKHILKYYISRVKRIYPELLVMLLTTIGFFHFAIPKVVQAIRPNFLSIVFGYNNWWQIAQNADYFTRITNGSPYTHLWFLGIEMQYYLIWPLLFGLFALIKKRKSTNTAYHFFLMVAIVTALIMPIMYIPGQDVTRIYYGTDTRIYALLAGACIGFAYQYGTLSERKGGMGIFLVYVLLTIFSYIYGNSQLSIMYRGGMIALTLLFVFMIRLLLTHQKTLGRNLEIPWIKWIAKHSYGIYLWQYPVLYFFNYTGYKIAYIWPIYEIVIICLLTIWTENLVHTPKKCLKNILTILCLTATVFMMLFGCISIVQSQDAVNQTELQQQLQANQKALKNQKTSERKVKLTKSQQYKKAGNTAKVDSKNMVMIGDSVLLGASSQIKEIYPDCVIDAKESRHISEEQPAVQDLLHQNAIKNTVVIALGTNGPLYDKDVQTLLDEMGKKRSIFWVNNYGPSVQWVNENNEILEKYAKKNSNITIIDWYTLATNHPEYIGPDGIHPNVDGQKAYAKMIEKSISTVENKQKKIDKEYADK